MFRFEEATDEGGGENGINPPGPAILIPYQVWIVAWICEGYERYSEEKCSPCLANDAPSEEVASQGYNVYDRYPMPSTHGLHKAR